MRRFADKTEGFAATDAPEVCCGCDLPEALALLASALEPFAIVLLGGAPGADFQKPAKLPFCLSCWLLQDALRELEAPSDGLIILSLESTLFGLLWGAAGDCNENSAAPQFTTFEAAGTLDFNVPINKACLKFNPDPTEACFDAAETTSDVIASGFSKTREVLPECFNFLFFEQNLCFS
jgi:hypothetical protein